MKLKNLIAVCLLLLPLVGHSQTTETIEFKPQTDENTLELLFDPGAIFGSNNNGQFQLDGGLKYRRFMTANTAVRMQFNLSATSSSYSPNYETDAEESLKSKSSNFDLLIAPGLEKHLAGTSRLSPYLGAQALIGLSTSKEKSEYKIYSDDNIYTETIRNPNGNDVFSIGAGVFAGTDFYVMEKLYLGLELGYSLVYSKGLKSKYKSDQEGVEEVESTNKASYFEMAPNAQAKFRIGWAF